MAELRVRKRKPPTEKMIDKSIEDSFPASDPPAVGRTHHAGGPKDLPSKDGKERSDDKNRDTSDK